MSDSIPPHPEPLHRNPQVVAAVIGGIITLVVAIVGVLPVLLNNRAPTPPPTLLIIIATAVPPTAASIATVETPTIAVTNTAIDVPAAQVATLSNTVPPTLEPTIVPPSPTSAAVLPPATAIPNVLLLFDDVSFTLLNQTNGKLSLEGITFHSASGDWDALRWGPSIYNSLPGGKCLRLRNAAVGNRQPPSQCGKPIYGLIEVGTSALFWVNVATFDVLRNGQVIATCVVSNQTCPIAVT